MAPLISYGVLRAALPNEAARISPTTSPARFPPDDERERVIHLTKIGGFRVRKRRAAERIVTAAAIGLIHFMRD